MVSMVKYFGALALLAAGSVIAVAGCAVEVEEPEPEEGASTEAMGVEEPVLDPQGNGNCCYGKCVGDAQGWVFLGGPANCKEKAKDFCAFIKKPFKDAAQFPGPC